MSALTLKPDDTVFLHYEKLFTAEILSPTTEIYLKADLI